MTSFVRSCLVCVGLAAIAPGASADETLPPAVAAAIGDALAVPGARFEARAYRARVPAGCTPARAETTRPVTASGRYAVKLTGGCTAWGQIELRVFAPVAVTTRALRVGEPLADAVTIDERELSIGVEPTDVPDGATAAKPLSRGAVIERGAVRAANATPGQSIKVIATAGALAIEQVGRLVPCGASRACAVLPNGKHVEGRLVAGRLVVELP